MRRITSKKVEYSIEGEKAKGVLVHDSIRLHKDSHELKEFPFLLINSWTENRFERVDGVIGLSRSYYSTDGSNSGPALLDALYQSGEIEKKIFSFHIDNYGQSAIQFGGYDMNNVAPGAPLTFIETPYDKDWKLTINAFRIGEKPTYDNGAKTAFYFEEKDAYLDSFSPYIKIPNSIAIPAFAKMLHGIKYERIDGLLFGPCDLDQYHTISLFVNDRYYLKLAPETFVIDIGNKDKCFLPIMYNSADNWVLGEPFFRSFYSVYDDAKGIIGLAPSINYLKAGIFEGVVPNDELPYARKNAAEKQQQ